MPNWVTINVHVTGEEKALQEFKEAHFVCDTDPEKPAWAPDINFDFNTIVPMPACLKDTTSPTPEDDKVNARVRAKMYGAENWYEWSKMNWDTKWNASDTYINYEDAVNMEFSINTAWTLPVPIFEELAELYPELTFELDCIEEGGFFSGQMTFDSDGNIDNLTDDEETWQRQASTLLGWEPDED
jgi:hypothetical protein